MQKTIWTICNLLEYLSILYQAKVNNHGKRNKQHDLNRCGFWAAVKGALVMNYFKAGKEYSSGIVEGLNLKINMSIRKTYGYRSSDNAEVTLLHQLVNLEEVLRHFQWFLANMADLFIRK